jgi:hypothetical protein
MPTIAERLKEIKGVDDAGLLMGYRFLVNRRRKGSAVKAPAKKAVAKKFRASASSQKIDSKAASKTG